MTNVEEPKAKVLNLWWEGDALHIVTDRGHTAYEGAYLTSQSFGTDLVERISLELVCPLTQVKSCPMIPDLAAWRVTRS
jgi:hypothetical protein